MKGNPTRLIACICFFISVIFFLSVFIPSCTKLDVNDARNWKNRKNFFDLPSNADPALEKVATEFERQNKLTGFVKGMVAREGMPVWEKSQIFKRKIANTLTRGGEAETLVEVFSPIVQQDNNYVNGFFYSKIIGDSVDLHLYRANDYDKYPYGKTDSSIVTAELISLKIVELDASIFGNRKYQIIPDSLFGSYTHKYSGTRFLKPSIPDTTNPNSLMGMACWYEFSGYCTCTNPPSTDISNCADWRTGCYDCSLLRCVSVGGQGGEPQYPWPPEPPMGGGGSGGGGGGSNPPTGGNCNGTNNCGTRGSIIIEGRVPCGGCGNPPIIVIPPDEPPTQLPQMDTCDVALNAAKKMDTLYTKGKVDSMWNAETGWQNLKYEKGFPIYKNFTQNMTTGTYAITNYFPGPMQGSSASMFVSITFSLPSYVRAAAQGHNHTDSGAAAHSPADVFELVRNYNIFNSPSSNMTYEGTFIQAFNNSKYAITISKPANAQSFYAGKDYYLDTITHSWKESLTAGFAYYRAFNHFYTIDSTTANPARTIAADELAQAAVLTSFNTGIILLKQDGSGKFKPIVIDIKPEPGVVCRKIYVRKCL